MEPAEGELGSFRRDGARSFDSSLLTWSLEQGASTHGRRSRSWLRLSRERERKGGAVPRPRGVDRRHGAKAGLGEKDQTREQRAGGMAIRAEGACMASCKKASGLGSRVWCWPRLLGAEADDVAMAKSITGSKRSASAKRKSDLGPRTHAWPSRRHAWRKELGTSGTAEGAREPELEPPVEFGGRARLGRRQEMGPGAVRGQKGDEAEGSQTRGQSLELETGAEGAVRSREQSRVRGGVRPEPSWSPKVGRGRDEGRRWGREPSVAERELRPRGVGPEAEIWS